VPRAVPLDFPAIADGVVRNNVGVDWIEVRVRARPVDGHVELVPTGQRVPLEGSGPEREGWHRFTVLGVAPTGGEIALHWLGAAATPGAEPEAAETDEARGGADPAGAR